MIPTGWYRRLGTAMDKLAQPAEDSRIGSREDTVPEVEDMPRPPGGAGEDVERRRLDPFPRAEQERGGEVALHRPVGACECPAVVEPQPPVEADHVATRSG